MPTRIKYTTEMLNKISGMYGGFKIHGDYVIDGLMHWDIEFGSVQNAASFAQSVVEFPKPNDPYAFEPLSADLRPGDVISTLNATCTLTVAQIDPRLWS